MSKNMIGFMAQKGFFQKVSSLYSTYFLGIQGKLIDIQSFGCVDKMVRYSMLVVEGVIKEDGR